MIKCIACGKQYSNDQVEKLKLLRATTSLKVENVVVICECGHTVQFTRERGFKNQIEVK